MFANCWPSFRDVIFNGGMKFLVTHAHHLIGGNVSDVVFHFQLVNQLSCVYSIVHRLSRLLISHVFNLSFSIFILCRVIWFLAVLRIVEDFLIDWIVFGQKHIPYFWFLNSQLGSGLNSEVDDFLAKLNDWLWLFEECISSSRGRKGSTTMT